VSRVPGEILAAERKDNFIDISMLRLRQDPPEVYLLGPGDVLGVYIKGVLGNDQELPPVHFPEDSNRPQQSDIQFRFAKTERWLCQL
jgi:hypothetical protein